jgi:Na+-driven multidrug efflux pump
MALYFASQGAGKVLWPLIAGVTRLLVATVGGWYWIAVLHGSLSGLYWIAAASLALFGIVNAAAFATGHSWGRRAKPPAARAAVAHRCGRAPARQASPEMLPRAADAHR